ncbi:hypothetical protein FACS1894196_2430 [Clostridia bacterium]|nr:hypothetical protein FACS1894196_2430 [Clostridia bacterium]
MQHVALPDAIEEIGAGAFSGCNRLWTIELPAGLKRIGINAFESCFWLEELTLPDGVEEIGAGAFWGCQSLKKVTLSRDLKSIGTSAFALAYNLESIALPEENKAFTVVDGVFYTSDMKDLVLYPFYLADETLTVPDGVETLSPGALQLNRALKEVVLPDTLQTIGELAFLGMPNLEKLVVPPSVTDFTNTGLPTSSALTIYGDAGSAAGRFEVSDMEVTRPGKTYTVDTLQASGWG